MGSTVPNAASTVGWSKVLEENIALFISET
jgi:hypothetical protein